MKNTLLPLFLFLSLSSAARADCREERMMGATLGQARLNCSVLKGYVTQCTQYATYLWSCGCAVDCRPTGDSPGERFTSTMGYNLAQARINCEMVLKGTASNCVRNGSALWSCDCYY